MQSSALELKSLLGVTAAGLLGAGVVVGAAQAAVAKAPPSILVFDQKSGKQVSIDYVNIPANGYVVVYTADADGKRSGTPLGSMAVNAGSHMDLKVDLEAAPKPGTNLWASLYKDKDGKEGFNPEADKAVWSKLPMQNAFTVQ